MSDRDEIMALHRTRIVRLVCAAAVLDALGAATAWRRGLVGEPFGIRSPVSMPFAVELVVWGSATSAPPVLDVAALYMSRRVPRRGVVGAVALGALRGIGVLSEPASWGRRRSPAAVVLAACHLGVAGALMAAGCSGARQIAFAERDLTGRPHTWAPFASTSVTQITVR